MIVAQAVAPTDRPREPRSLWTGGTKTDVVDPALLQEAFRSGERLPTAKDLVGENAYAEGPLNGRLLGDGIRLHGCGQRAHNACDASIHKAQVDGINRTFNRFVRNLTKLVARSCEVLVVAEGSGPRLF